MLVSVSVVYIAQLAAQHEQRPGTSHLSSRGLPAAGSNDRRLQLRSDYLLYLMLYKMALTFKSVDKNLWCDHSNAVRSCGAVCYAVQIGSNFCPDFCG